MRLSGGMGVWGRGGMGGGGDGGERLTGGVWKISFAVYSLVIRELS